MSNQETNRATKNPNSNCLERKRCPRCGSYGPFEVVVVTRVLLYDTGAGDAEEGGIEYGDESRTRCPGCRYEGRFVDFDEVNP
jgi:hypothetical protein